MTNIKDFFGYKAEWDDCSSSYIIEFFSSDEVNSFYDIVQSKCYKTNFQMDPYNSNAYGYFKCDNVEYFTSSPVQVNGDNNWYEYPKQSKRYVTISPVDMEQFMIIRTRTATINAIIK